MKYIIQDLKTKGYFIKFTKDGGAWWTVSESLAMKFNSYEKAFDVQLELYDQGNDTRIIEWEEVLK